MIDQVIDEITLSSPSKNHRASLRLTDDGRLIVTLLVHDEKTDTWKAQGSGIGERSLAQLLK